MMCCWDLALEVPPDTKIKRIQIGWWRGSFLFGNKVGNIGWYSHSCVFLVPCDSAKSSWNVLGHFFKVFFFPGQQWTNKDVILVIFLVQFDTLFYKNQRTSYRFGNSPPDHHWCHPLDPSDSSRSYLPITWPNTIILGIHIVLNIEFLFVAENEVRKRASLKAGEENFWLWQGVSPQFWPIISFFWPLPHMFEWGHLQISTRTVNMAHTKHSPPLLFFRWISSDFSGLSLLFSGWIFSDFSRLFLWTSLLILKC